ncbi:hypothetical protein Ddc_20557 [Ditylenchus destructor]|nr:hypothetical protein Ddc_20557 [Ditylenchus destructor]
MAVYIASFAKVICTKKLMVQCNVNSSTNQHNVEFKLSLSMLLDTLIYFSSGIYLYTFFWDANKEMKLRYLIMAEDVRPLGTPTLLLLFSTPLQDAYKRFFGLAPTKKHNPNIKNLTDVVTAITVTKNAWH